MCGASHLAGRPLRVRCEGPGQAVVLEEEDAILSYLGNFFFSFTLLTICMIGYVAFFH